MDTSHTPVGLDEGEAGRARPHDAQGVAHDHQGTGEAGEGPSAAQPDESDDRPPPRGDAEIGQAMVNPGRVRALAASRLLATSAQPERRGRDA
jgi:hypothetical protein